MVVDVTDGTLAFDQAILIEGSRITAVGPVDEIDASRAAEIVDAAGAYVIPGLWDMHVHSVANVALDVTMDNSSASIAAQDWHFPLFLAHGVTGVRNMNDRTGDLTLELTNAVRRRLAERDLPGPPRFLSAGPSIDGDPPLGSNAVAVGDAAEARAAVKQLVANGADLVKIYENLSREAYFGILEEARRRGISVDGHLPFRVTPEEAAEAGQRTVEHPDGMAAGCSTDAEALRQRYDRILANFDQLPESEQFLVQFRLYRALNDSRDPAACERSIEAYRRHRVAVAVDLVAYHHVVHANEILADTSRMQFVPPTLRRSWQEQAESEIFREFQSILRPIVPLELENTRLFNDGGVTLLAATDTGVPMQVPGISLHVELERLVKAGLSPLEALQTATLNPAAVLGMRDDLGTVEAGKLADIVLLDANPLEDIANTRRIRAVIADGRLYRRADLDVLLSEVKKGYVSTRADSPAAAADRLLSDLHARGQFNGAVILGRDGEIVYEGARGLANVEAGVPFTPDTVVDGASLAKNFTVAAIWMLVDEGRLDLDTPVQTYVPEYPHPQTTVRRLIEHSAGLPEWEEWEGRTNEGLILELRARGIPPRFPPGSRYEYCNACYDVAALVIERVSGQEWYTFLRQRVFDPLGMTSTFLRPAQLANWPGVRTLSYRHAEGTLTVYDVYDNEAYYGGANLYFSARDLHRWITSWYSEPVLNEAALARGMQAPVFANGEISALNRLNWYSLPGRRAYFFTGHWRGFHHEVYWDADQRLSVVWVSNVVEAKPLPPLLTRALIDIVEGRQPEPIIKPSFQAPQSGETLEPMAGSYHVEALGQVSVIADGDDLFVKLGNGFEHQAFPAGSYTIPDLYSRVWFSDLSEDRYQRIHWLSLEGVHTGDRVTVTERDDDVTVREMRNFQ